jgi:hypothetical protein
MSETDSVHCLPPAAEGAPAHAPHGAALATADVDLALLRALIAGAFDQARKPRDFAPPPRQAPGEILNFKSRGQP